MQLLLLLIASSILGSQAVPSSHSTRDLPTAINHILYEVGEGLHHGDAALAHAIKHAGEEVHHAVEAETHQISHALDQANKSKCCCPLYF